MHKSGHTCKHICNSHKPIRKPKIAKELASFPPGQNYFLKFPSLLKFLKRDRTTHDRTATRIDNDCKNMRWTLDTKDRTTGHNSGLAEMAGSVVKATFVHLINFVPGDSEVLRIPPLRKPANRWQQVY